MNTDFISRSNYFLCRLHLLVYFIDFLILVLCNRRYFYFSFVPRFIIFYFPKVNDKMYFFQEIYVYLKFLLFCQSIQFNVSFLVDIAILSRLLRLFKLLLNMKKDLERIHEMRLYCRKVNHRNFCTGFLYFRAKLRSMMKNILFAFVIFEIIFCLVTKKRLGLQRDFIYNISNVHQLNNPDISSLI